MAGIPVAGAFQNFGLRGNADGIFGILNILDYGMRANTSVGGYALPRRTLRIIMLCCRAYTLLAGGYLEACWYLRHDSLYYSETRISYWNVF